MPRTEDELLNDRADFARKNEKLNADKAGEISIAYHNNVALIHIQQMRISELSAKLREREEALENIMISGNDLSTGIGMTPEGDLALKYPYDTDNQIVMDDLDYGFLYCMWICWATIMRERDKLEDHKPNPPKKELTNEKC